MVLPSAATVLLTASLALAGSVQSERPAARAAWADPATLVIDGDAAEWRGTQPAAVTIERLEQFVQLGPRPPRELWAGPDDASLALWLGWNDSDLVLYGEVHDQLADHEPSAWFQGDSLELFFDVGERAPTWGLDDYQMMLAPDWPERPWGVYPRPGQGGDGAVSSDCGFGGVEVVHRPFIGGYRFEARVPWRNFARYQPAPQARLGLNVALCDRDGVGALESYGTWSGERDLAQYADRRGELVLAPPEASSGAGDSEQESGTAFEARSLLLLALAAMYAIALWTRKVWRAPRARRVGILAAVGVCAAAFAVAFVARWVQQSESSQARNELERYWVRFDDLLKSGALGHPEPVELLGLAQALLNNQTIAPIAPRRIVDLAPAGGTLRARRRTERRGIPYAPLPGPAGEGVALAPGQSLSLATSGPLSIDAIHVVTRIRDASFQRAAAEQVAVLSIEARRAGQVLPVTRELRHRQDLHFEEDEHVDHPGLEPAFWAPSGRLGRSHADGLLLELGSACEIDEVVVRHVGAANGYAVEIVAVGARSSPAVDQTIEPPPGLRVASDGNWQWAGALGSVEVEVTPAGRAPKSNSPDQLARAIRLGDEPVGTAHLRSREPVPRASRWDFLPAAAIAAVAPFLVTLFAEWLAARRRIRGKLALGFAASSAVPLLALTVLLDASLRSEHEQRETERARAVLVQAERQLDREITELTREAQRLLRIAELQKKVRGVFPETAEELTQWWGEADGAARVLERTTGEGRRVRVASGPGAAQIPRGRALRSGLDRPWGQLLVCGLAQTATGAEQPLSVLVARPPSLPDSSGATPRTAASSKAADADSSVRLIGGGRDPAPTAADIAGKGERELRRAVYGADGEQLVGVLVASKRERGIPVLGDFALTELLLAAGITALFTALLFAGILTAHIVGPIERLDRAVRAGEPATLDAGIDDEIGHLTAAVRSYSSEVAERVRQLETLQLAHGELSRRLDPLQAREAVIAFFAKHAGAASVWVVWRGEPGSEARAWGAGGRDLAVPDEAALVLGAVHEGAVVHWLQRSPSTPLSPFERLLLGPDPARVLCLPLIAGGEERGAVVLAYATDEERTDVAFLRAAATQSAIVLENARLYSEAVRDSITGFLSDPGFRQRVAEEIQRAETEPGAGVLLLQLRLTGLPEDDEQAAARLREAARRLRLAVRGMAIFGRAGSADLEVAIPWTQQAPDAEAVARRLVDRVALGPWPDGEAVEGLLVAQAAWPTDGPSAMFVMGLLEERLAEAQTGAPAAGLVRIASEVPADFVASSPIMLQLLDTLQRIAEREITVLVTGETGSGKDRIAELIHKWSPRAQGPLVHVHCPSLSPALIEDELFGHEKGAFTGAHSRRMGPFEFAAGGTLVLDEVAGLPPAGQVALLRLLEAREVVPLGGTRRVPLDVRIVATSSRDLAREVERGAVRRDLYFRLNVAQVSVPPLRLRRQAIPDLVAAFLRRFNASAARPVTGVVPQVMDVLFEHDWPGNVRELENVLSRALILAAGGELGPEHIDLEAPTGTDGLGPHASVTLAGRQERLLEQLAAGQLVSSSEYAAAAGVSARTALRDLLDMAELGLLVREGQRRGTRFRRSSKPYLQRSGHQ